MKRDFFIKSGEKGIEFGENTLNLQSKIKRRDMNRCLKWLLMVVTMVPMGMSAQENHQLEVGKNLDIFNALYSNLDLFYVDTLNPKQTMTAAIKGMLRSLDPYTEYYPEDEKKNLQMMLTGKYAGIGALIKYHLI